MAYVVIERGEKHSKKRPNCSDATSQIISETYANGFKKSANI